ncbi:glyoxalase/bleomycin resistance/dioxygenase family protein [Mesorhizobium loti]|nr:VOC family protein [Mesorhizobium loti]PLP60546.1 glyoxalase/bleomycin resistance/dioxygenase family protein [Mesorhizobium loti]
MGKLHEIVFESEAPAALARFWAALLDGYEVRAYDEAEISRLASLGFTPETDPTVLVDGPGPSLCFQRVGGRRYDNNRLHLDIAVDDRQAEATRHIALGATVQRKADGYSVMHDPEGNQYCLTDMHRT